MGAVSDGLPEVGSTIAEKYRVLGVLGSGGMGWLVKAEHLLLNKAVAIKFLRAREGRSVRRRFFREARAAQSLSSEHVVRVFDLGVYDQAPYIVMELLEGTDLAALVDDGGPLAVEEAVDSVAEACVAVAEAHALGIVHRDIKPANLFATRTPTKRIVKVLDFGISKVPEPDLEEDCERTGENTVLGTPYYMSPEQLRNPANIDGRSDVWALAVTLFYLLSGEHPFAGANPREVTAAIFADPPRDLSALRPELPRGLCEVIAAALAKRPEARTESIAMLVQQLSPYASKRGRAAAERIAALGEPVPPSAPAPTAGPARGSRAQTDAGLSTTLPTTENAPKPTASAAGPSKPRVLSLGLLGVAAAGAIGWIVVSSMAPAPSNLDPKPGAPEPQGPAAAAAEAEPAAEIEAAPSAAAVPIAASVSAARAPSASRPPAHAPAAPPTPTIAPPASASAAPRPRLDIDGVPIVD